MGERQQLPNRRPSETWTICHDGRDYSVTVGFDPATGAVREVFATDAKSGSAMDWIVADACVVVSIALQYGVPAAALSRSVGRVAADLDDPASATVPASIVGALVDLLASVASGRAAP